VPCPITPQRAGDDALGYSLVAGARRVAKSRAGLEAAAEVPTKATTKAPTRAPTKARTKASTASPTTATPICNGVLRDFTFSLGTYPDSGNEEEEEGGPGVDVLCIAQ